MEMEMGGMEPTEGPQKSLHDPSAGPVGGIMVEGQRSMQEELASLIVMKKQYNKLMIGGGLAIGVLFMVVISLIVSAPDATVAVAEQAELDRVQAELEQEQASQAAEQAELERLEAELATGPNVAGGTGAHPATQLRAGVPAPVGTSPLFCFGAHSSETYTERWSENLYIDGLTDFTGTRWRIVDDDPINEPGYWATYTPELLEPNSFATGQGWSVYQGSNAWGNYPGDNALSGTFLMYDGAAGTRMDELRATDADMDEFIIEADIMLHDNDGIGFVFGFQHINDHFTAVEINDQWPGPAADGVSGPFQKIHKRNGPLPGQGTCGIFSAHGTSGEGGEGGWSAEDAGSTRRCGGSMVNNADNRPLGSMDAGVEDANTVYTLLPSPEGDDGLSINKVNYNPYPEGGEWFKIGLKVTRINRRRGEYTQDVGPSYFVTYQSTRKDRDSMQSSSADGGYMVERITARVQDSLYRGGKIGLFTYATQMTVDNIAITPIGTTHAEVSYCSGAGQCSNEMYSASVTDDIYLGGCPIETSHTFTTQFCAADESRCPHCTQFDTLRLCMEHCSDLGPACGGCTIECHDGTHGGGVDDDSTCGEVVPPDCGDSIDDCPAAGRGPACDPSAYEPGVTPTDGTAGCWKYEIRSSTEFRVSPYHERSFKKLSYTCLCDVEPHTVTSGALYEDVNVFPDCSRSYQDLEEGCMDPAARNYDPHAGKHDHSCRYSFEHGALDFSFTGTLDPNDPMDGHVAIAAGTEALPQRDHTVECWVKLMGVSNWAGPVSFGQDDAGQEYGVFLSMRTDAALPDGSAYLTYGLSTDGSNDGDGHMTYLGYEGPSGPAPAAVVDSTEDQWHHWAGTYDGTVMTLYVDGVPVATDATSNSRDVNYPPRSYRRSVDQIHGGWFTLGAYHDANEYIVLNGALDDVRIWNRALAAREMTADPAIPGGACHPLTGTEAGLMHYFHFDELVGGNYGDVVQNAVAGGATGFLVGDVKRLGHSLCDASGCMDPVAKNYCGRSGTPCTTSDHSCQYRWTAGSILTEPGMHDEQTVLSQTGAGTLEGFSNVRGHVAVEGITVGDATQLPMQDLTIECWVKLEGVMEWSGCVSMAQDDGQEEFGFTMSTIALQGNSVQLGFGLATVDGTSDDSADGLSQNVCADGRRCGMTYLGSLASRVTAGDGLWHHWVATYDGRTMTVLLDGVVAATDSTSQSGALIYPRDDYQAMGGGLFTIAAYHDSNEYWPMLGSTDEVRIWNTALTGTEPWMTPGSCRGVEVIPLPASLLGYWKLDENQGADVLNEVRGGSQGVLVGDVMRVGDDATSCQQGGRR